MSCIENMSQFHLDIPLEIRPKGGGGGELYVNIVMWKTSFAMLGPLMHIYTHR